MPCCVSGRSSASERASSSMGATRNVHFSDFWVTNGWGVDARWGLPGHCMRARPDHRSWSCDPAATGRRRGRPRAQGCRRRNNGTLRWLAWCPVGSARPARGCRDVTADRSAYRSAGRANRAASPAPLAPVPSTGPGLGSLPTPLPTGPAAPAPARASPTDG